jgi:LPXTG-motif cell wall-anchored protein
MPKRMLLVILTMSTLVLASLVVSAVPASAQYCPTTTPDCGTVTGTGTEIPPGGTVELTGHGFKPGTDVLVQILGCPDAITLGTVKADNNFEAKINIVVPAACCAGIHDVTFTGVDADGHPLVETYQLTVTGEAGSADACHGVKPTVPPGVGGTGTATGSKGSLPRTGSNAGTPVAVGIGLVLFGGVLVVLARRRTTARRHGLSPGT